MLITAACVCSPKAGKFREILWAYRAATLAKILNASVSDSKTQVEREIKTFQIAPLTSTRHPFTHAQTIYVYTTHRIE